MPSSPFVNGAPMTQTLGIQDGSIRAPALKPEAIPSHCPKIYIYAQKGAPRPQLLVGNARNQYFGDDTFDERKKFANHQTVLSNKLNAVGNAQMIERLIPADAGPKSNLLLSLDVLSTTIPQYQRASDGSVIRNADTNMPVLATPAASLAGFKVKFVITHVTEKTAGQTDAQLFGAAAITQGDQTDGATQSMRYPIAQWWANSEGEIFDNSGLRLWAPTTSSTGGVNSRMITGTKVYPYRMAAVRRPDVTSTAAVVTTEGGAPYFDFTFKESVINPATGAQYSLQDTYLQQYQLLEDPRFADKYADLNGMKLYTSNIETLLNLFYQAEKTHRNSLSDFTGVGDEKHLFNFLSGTSSNDCPYYTYQVDTTAADAVSLSESTNLYASGGADGTMNDTLFAGLVGNAIAEYANPDSFLMDSATQVESIFYDTGFPIATKLQCAKFIAERKDLALVLSVYDPSVGELSASEEHSVALTLRTKLLMYPESDYFGTSTMRAVIIGRSGTLIDSLYTKPLPLTIELAVKTAKLAGAGDGKWKREFMFDRAPGSEITMFRDVSVGFSPAKQRIKDWDVGLNYPMSFSRKTLYFPALKTVYDNDTSVLNSFFVMLVCVELQKIGERTHRNFSGSVTLTDAQLIDQVNKDVLRQSIGRFGGLAQIVPNAFISDGDAQRGYSWSLPIDAYFNSMKTAMALSLRTYRMSDYVAA